MSKIYNTPSTVVVAFPGGVVYEFTLVIGMDERADGSIFLVRSNGSETIINNNYDYIEVGA